MFGKKTTAEVAAVDKFTQGVSRELRVRETADALRAANTFEELETIVFGINADTFPDADDRVYLSGIYNDVWTALTKKEHAAPAPSKVDTRDTFQIALDNIGRTLATHAKRREWLEVEIAKLSEELYQINVTSEALTTARDEIVDHSRSLNKKREPELADLEAETEAPAETLTGRRASFKAVSK